MAFKNYRQLHDVIDSVIKPSCTKYGFITHKIISHWQQIVGINLAKISQPLEVTFEPMKTTDGILIVGITHPGFSLEILGAEIDILSKISIYFGYRAINRIKTKIFNQKTPKLCISNPIQSNLVRQQQKTAFKEKDSIDPAQHHALLKIIANIALKDQELARQLEALKNSLFSVQ